MNEITHPDRASDVPWPTHPQVREPDAPALPGSAQGAAATTVRGHPLAWLAAAVALGAVIARIGRSSR